MGATITDLTDEAGFHAALDADPTDGWTRQVFADWLDEHGDPRGPGYRAMGVLGVSPLDNPVGPWGAHEYDETGWEWWARSLTVRAATPAELYPHSLPDDWLALLETPYRYRIGGMLKSCDFFTRRQAEDAAALAFAKLPAARQAELLAKDPE